jgi:hypothetical protein
MHWGVKKLLVFNDVISTQDYMQTLVMGKSIFCNQRVFLSEKDSTKNKILHHIQQQQNILWNFHWILLTAEGILCVAPYPDCSRR